MTPAPAAPSSALRRAASREWWILALLLALLAGTLGWQNGLGRIDYTIYDAAVSSLARTPSNDIVIVAIDEVSLGQIGRWPWPRAVHAALLDRITPARPKAIALDLILTEPEAGEGDAVFAAAIERAAPVVLAVLLENAAQPGVLKTSMPVERLAGSAAALGHIHAELDRDGIARSVFLLEGLVESDSRKSATWPHFALALKEAGLPASAGDALPGERNPNRSSPPGVWRRDHWIHIPFAGPPGTYTRIAYADVLRGAVPASAFTGKFVLVGATAAGLGDAYPTPVSGGSRAMPGIEIHANVLDNLLRGRAIVRAAPWTNALASALIVFAVLAGLFKFSPRRGLLLTALALAAVLFACWALMAFADIWLAPAACLTGLILAYPLWSWRRLEATMRFLGDEFSRIQSEPAILPATPARSMHAGPGSDALERRLLALEVAAGQMRDTRRFVADTLNSHPDAILVTDMDGTTLLANQAAAGLFGIGVENKAGDAEAMLRGQSVERLMRGWTARAGQNAPLSWATLRDSAQRAVEPLELISVDGRSLLAHCARGAGAEGATLGWIVSLIDVSALRTAEARRDEALAFLSHDMRSPQSSILALLELHTLDPDNHPVESVHARIESYVRRTLDLSDQFLQVSRAETKEYELEMVDAAEVCSLAVDETWAAAEKKRIVIMLLPPTTPLMLAADRPLLTRAIANLLSNAVKYSPEGTQVTVTVAARGPDQPGGPAVGAGAGRREVMIEVADHGYGISVEDQQQLFTRYRRFSTPGQPKAAGAGLGMVFVKTVAERHGGRIEVESVTGSTAGHAAEKGTRFRLLLPARSA